MTNKETLADIVQAIKENANEIKNKDKRSDQDYGQLLAYAESLSIIRDACYVEERKALGLDFDIDKEYLL